MGRYSVLVRMNGRIDIVKMFVLPRAMYITYSNLQIQHKLHQHLNDIIHRNRTKKTKPKTPIYMEPKKALSQNNPEKKEQS